MANAWRAPCEADPVLFHPDYTVGPGIKPGLLTLPHAEHFAFRQALAGYAISRLPPVGNCTPP